MLPYTYLIIALAIVGHVRAAEEAAGAPEPYAYGYEAPDHAATEERKPDGTVSGYYTLKDVDGRSRRVNYVADESGFHANVETNEHGTKTSNPADAQILASPANQEQLFYQQRVQYQQQQPQTVAQQVLAQPPKVQTQQVQYGYQYQPGYAYGSTYAYGAKPSSSAYGYNSGLNAGYYGTTGSAYYPGTNTGYYGTTGSSYNPGSSNGYYATTGSGYYPGSTNTNYATTSTAYNPSSAYGTQYNNAYTTSYGSPASYQGLSTSSYGVGDGSVYGSYNYHTPTSYHSATRTSGQQVVGRPFASGVNYVTNTVVPASQSVYRTVSTSNSGVRSAQPIVGSSNYSIIQKREAEVLKTAQSSQKEKANQEKQGQENKLKII